MPLLRLSATPGAFDDAARSLFVRAVTVAACAAEQLPDVPEARARAVVLWHQLEPGEVAWGAELRDDHVRAVFADYLVGDGVLDPVGRERFAADFHSAALSGAPPGDTRQTFTSVVFTDVAEGRWGRDGSVQRLPAMAHAAGFRHLAEIAAP